MKKIFLLMTIPALFFLGGCASESSSTSEANAQTLDATTTDVISSSFTYTDEATDTDGLVTVYCPDDMVAISPGCNCDITTTGAIFGLRLIGNAVICACIPNDLDGYDVVHAYVCQVRRFLSFNFRNKMSPDFRLRSPFWGT